MADSTPGGPAAAVRATVAPSSIADVVSLVLSIVADKTGYPVEVLGPEMDLETDLGIDSIKRVEILGALREEFPDLASVIDVGSEQAIELVKLRTVGEISERLREALSSSSAGISLLDAPTSPMPATAQAVANGGDASSHPRVPTVQARDVTSSTPILGSLDRMGLATGSGNGSHATPGVAMTRRVMRAVAAPPHGSPMPGLGTGSVVITNDGTGVAEALAELLRSRGLSVLVVADGEEPPADARNLILLDGLRPVGCPEDAMAVQHRAFRSARGVAAAMERDGGVFVTVQDTGGDFGLAGANPDRAWLGGLAALARTAALEWPQVAVKAIDCERGGRIAVAVAEAIVTELETGGADLDVGLSAVGAPHHSGGHERSGGADRAAARGWRRGCDGWGPRDHRGRRGGAGRALPASARAARPYKAGARVGRGGRRGRRGCARSAVRARRDGPGAGKGPRRWRCSPGGRSGGPLPP